MGVVVKRRLFVILSVALFGLAGIWVGCSTQNGEAPLGPNAAETAKTVATIPGQVHANIPIAAHLDASASADGCENNPGPFITLSGDLTLGGINARLIFRNNVIGTHERTEDVTQDVVILNQGQVIRFAKQPPQGGVGGNPYIWIEFFDGSWNSISGPTFLGRCVQGLRTTNLDLGLLSGADVQVASSGDCDNSPGPQITLNGEISLGGLNARLYFTNNAKGTHLHEEATQVDLVILPAGQSIKFAKQPPRGGVGGNPRIYFQFTTPSGQALSGEFYLGRCVQMSK